MSDDDSKAAPAPGADAAAAAHHPGGQDDPGRRPATTADADAPGSARVGPSDAPAAEAHSPGRPGPAPYAEPPTADPAGSGVVRPGGVEQPGGAHEAVGSHGEDAGHGSDAVQEPASGATAPAPGPVVAGSAAPSSEALPPAGSASAGSAAPGVDATSPAAAPAASGSSGGFFRELPFLVVVALALALLIKAFLVQAFYIPSGSMEQTLAIRDRVLVNKLVYDFRDVHRGEIIVFDAAGSLSADPDQEIALEPTNPVRRALRKVGGVVGLGAPGEKDFIKRVIGMPGDRVACCTNGHVTVQPPGGTPVELDEPYTFGNETPIVFCQAGADETSCPAGSPGVLVPQGRLFVMGDHRCCSSDSRLHLDDGQMGTVPENKVIGRAFVVVWPLGRATVLKVPQAFDTRALALPATTATAVPYALGAVGALPVGMLRRRRRRAR